MSARLIWRSLFLSERKGAAASSEIQSEYLDRYNKFRAKANLNNRVVKSYINEITEQLSFDQPRSPGVQPNSWLEEIIFALESYDVQLSLAAIDSAQITTNDLPFCLALEPITYYFREKLLRGCHNKGILISDALIEDFYYFLIRELSVVVGLTLYCLYQDENEISSPENLRSWSLDCALNRWPQLIIDYPVMGRLLVERANMHINSTIEIFLAYERDKKRLFDSKILADENLKLTNMEMVLSDYHNGGRSVCRLHLDNNSTLIYKPKSLANDCWFFETFLNAESCIFGKIAVLDCGDYGWAEDVLSKTEDVAPQTHKENLAQVAGLAYLLNATDLHPENIIVTNDKVYLLDLETLMNGMVTSLTDVNLERNYSFLSVLSTQIFKSHFSIEQRDRPVSDEGDLHIDLTAPVYYLVGCPQNGVRLGIVGKKQDASDENVYEGMLDRYEDLNISAIKKEFIDFCQQTHQEIFVDKTWLKLPESISCRFVPRPTIFYARIFQRIYHPYYLKDAASISLELSGLILTLNDMHNEIAEKWAKLIRDEIKQIQSGDIPYFYYNIHSTALHSSSGLLDPDFLQITAAKLFKEKNVRLTANDIRDQGMLIEASLRYLTKQVAGNARANYIRDKNIKFYNEQVIAEKSIELCVGIANDIIECGSKRGDLETRWISYLPDQSGGMMTPTMTDQSFYSGYWGILMYLDACESTLKNLKHVDYYESLRVFLNSEATIWEKNKGELSNINQLIKNTGISGAAGHLRALLFLCMSTPLRWGFLQGEIISVVRALSENYELRIVESVLTLEQNKGLYDYMWGECGLMSVLCDLDKHILLHHKDRNIINSLIDLIYRSLIQNLQSYLNNQEKSAWEHPPLIGFSHGNAGVIYALTKYIVYCKGRDNVCHFDGCYEAIELLMQHDNKYMLSDESTWLDKRYEVDKQIPAPASWCHGLPGIGLSRIAIYNFDKYRDIACKELEIVLLNLIQKDTANESDFYCCGIAGQIDFLFEYSKLFVCEQASDHMNYLLQDLLSRIGGRQEFSSLMGQSSFGMCAGLFQGASGIGYTLLRLLNSNLPSLSL
ncbi:MAG: type 2 lanthipeptide synthetase LanM [Alphaproteobacteria bacterium]|nr:type 2 lanthipeptide synthetase LanM [Alphaproteobacteria bacterium]